MILFTPKLSRQIKTMNTRSIYRLLLLDGNSNPLQTCKHRSKPHPSSRSIDCCLVNPFDRALKFASQRKFMSSVSQTILLQARDPASLAMEIQNALDKNSLEDAWRLYEQHMQMDGFPRKSLVNRLLAISSETLGTEWLHKSFGLTQQACEEGKQNLLERDTLIYLSFSLAKSGLVIPASTVLRKLIEMEQFPSVIAWSAILAHMSQTDSGAYLSAELVLEIGYLFQDSRVDPRKKTNAPLISMKPNTNSFSIALAGCLLFKTTKKAEQLLDMMPRVGVKLDSNLLIIMAHIYERNGRIEELKKLQRHINDVYNLSEIQFLQFHNCLITCHLKLGDLDSASDAVLDMLRKTKVANSSLSATSLLLDGFKNERNRVSSGLEDINSTEAPMISFDEFSRNRKFVKLESETKEVLNTMLAKLRNQIQLVKTERGIVQPTDKLFVKLVKAYLEAGKTKDLAEFLIKAERENSPVSNDDSFLIHVVNSCISLGQLDHAHDLIDEMRLAGIRPTPSVYSSLLKAYCGKNRTREAESLLRDANRAGIQLDSHCYKVLIQSKVSQNENQEAFRLFREMKEAKLPKAHGFEELVKGCSEGGQPKLMAKLLEEIREGQKGDCGVHDWNNVIHFFSKKRLMQDAEKALKKMLSLGHKPNAQTFHSMVTGYAAIGGNYVQVTELWGEMKSMAIKFDQELLDSVLYTFVRGGFFSRANEVVEMMEKGKMFVDKYKYRTLFLKYHKTLYKGKAPKFQSESQLRKREAGLAFKSWVGLN